MFTYSVTLKVAYFQSPKKALVISLPFFFLNYLIRNAGICYININILVNACCLLSLNDTPIFYHICYRQ